MTREQVAQAWRTALDPGGEWVQRVLEAADRRLTEVRREIRDAGGLVIASDHDGPRVCRAAAPGQRYPAGRCAVRRPDREQEDSEVRLVR